MENTYKVLAFVSKDGLFLEDWGLCSLNVEELDVNLTPNLLKSRFILVEEAEEAEEAEEGVNKLLADSLGLDIVEFTVSCDFSKKIHKHNPESKQNALDTLILGVINSMVGECNA